MKAKIYYLTLVALFAAVLLIGSVNAMKINSKSEKALVAGGCFWCMEPPFEKLDGVISVVSGYTGGDEKNPTYKMVSSGQTHHLEAVLITFDPQRVSYKDILEVFWRSIDPTDSDGQFADRGDQYKTAIFYFNEQQKETAIQSKLNLEKSGKFEKAIATVVLEAGSFYEAEQYHQDYYLKNSEHYKTYRLYSGRETFLKQTWQEESKTKYSKPDKKLLKERLTELQYKVTQRDGTEPAFNNTYWDNKQAGIYVDIVSGEPLFSSTDKFESGTGWPSFSKPLEKGNLTEHKDRNLFMERIEVRSKYGDSHLGHVFNDGPEPTGLRYCINSAALRFVPVDSLKKEGLKQYEHLFKPVSKNAK